MAEDIKKSPVPFFIKPITSAISGKIYSNFLGPNFETHFSFLEQQLETSPNGGNYLCGPNLTGADILMSFPLIAAKDGRGQGLKEGKYPLLSRYIERLEQEPGYKKAAQKIVDINGKFKAVM
jgi:glutathione S-transferase